MIRGETPSMDSVQPASQSPRLRGIRSPFRLIAAVLLCNLAGILGSLVTVTGPGSWYASIQKPPFNPPGFLFAPVWTTLYILMGISLYLVWMEGTSRRDVRIALPVFGLQLALNCLWSFLFFGLRSPFLGLAGILILWVCIVATIVLFWPIRRAAALLLAPYIAWVTFAAFLNFNIWLLNG